MVLTKRTIIKLLFALSLGIGFSTAYAQVCGLGANLVAGRWTMISLPCLPNSATVQDVLGDDLGVGTYGMRWVVYERNEAADTYQKLSLSSNLTQGAGYWILSLDNAALGVTGTATPLTTGNANCPSAGGCFEVMLTSPDTQLGTRQNMVGHPFPFDVEWADAVVEVDGVAYTPSAAETAGLVSKTINKYNGNSYSPFDDITPGMQGVLNVYDGFWVETLGGSAGKTAKLLIGDPQQPPAAQNDSYSFAASADQNVAAGAGLFVDNGSGADILGNPAATLTSFGGGSLGGAVTDNAAATSVAFAGGTLTVNADGSWSLTGQPFTGGTFTFNYRLTNSAGTSDAQVTTEIVPAASCSDDSYTATGNLSIDSINGVNQGVLSNDSGSPLSVTGFDAISNNGGTVNVLANGEFTYSPPPGFNGADSFTYTANGTLTCAVNITISDMIWFIDNSQGVNGDGRRSSPFNSLTNFNIGATDLPGDSIFLSSQSATNYTGPLMLLNDQILVGQGSTDSIDTVANITLAPLSDALPATGGTRPVIAHSTNNLTLAQNNTVRGLDIGNTGGTALTGSNFGTFTVSETSVNNTNGMAINLSTGTLAASFTSVSANGGANGILLNNTPGSFTVTGDGSTATQGGNGSGGNIENTSGSGILLTNASNVLLNNMRIRDAGLHGVQATSITNFDLAGVTISGAGNALNEHGIFITNLIGTGGNSNNFNNLVVDDSDGDTAILILQTAANAGELLIDGPSRITNALESGFEARTQNAGAQLDIIIGNTSAAGTGETLLIENTSIGAAFFAESGIMNATVRNSQIRNGAGVGTINRPGSNTNGVMFVGVTGQSTGSAADINLTVTGNDIDHEDGGAGGTGRSGIALGGAGNVNGTITNNSVDSNDEFTDAFFTNFTGVGTTFENQITITGNTFNLTGSGGNDTIAGIEISASDSSGGLTTTITNNNIIYAGDNGFSGGIILLAGDTGGGDNNTLCVDIFSNQVANINSGSFAHYGFVHFSNATLNIAGLGPGVVSDAQVDAYIVANDHPAATTTGADVNATVGTINGVTSCP